MAKHRRFRPYLRGQIQESQGLGTLAPATGVKNAVDDTVDDTTYCTSIVATWTMTGWTGVDGAGPIVVGIAHSDYTLAEIEEWIENASSWKRADLRQQEVARRKIRRVGVFASADAAPDAVQVLNNGRPLKTKCGWILSEDATLALWYYNAGTAAVASTIPVVNTDGHANLWPQ